MSKEQSDAHNYPTDKTAPATDKRELSAPAAFDKKT
jgi:hypothetical protein